MILALEHILSQAIHEGELIITATKRLAKQWSSILGDSKLCTRTMPQILSQSDWLIQIWEKLEAQGLTKAVYLLSAQQENVLWRKMIESSSHGERLLRVQATAKSVAQAFTLLKQWDLNLEHIDSTSDLTEETRLFLQWAHEFNQMLIKESWINQASLATKIIDCLSDKHRYILEPYSLVKRIKLLGFEAMTPQFKKFYTALRLQGWEVVELQDASLDNQAHARKYTFYDKTAELRAAALWAKALKTQARYPGAIGIVVPDLDQCRSQVVQIFTEILEPLTELQPAQSVSESFNISVAPPLSSYPIIFSALKILDLLKRENKSPEMSSFFEYSPFIVLRSDSVLSEFKHSVPLTSPLSDWAQVFEQFLKQMGWPGERRLNSIEHQAMARWQLLLTEFSALGSILKMQTLKGALQLLNELAHETSFQGQSKPAPIHIMGMLEASSQPFEYLWVSGLHNEAWPPIPQANPFLPLVLQRQYDMPHASTEREYAFSKKLLDNLKKSCDTVILSYYKNDAIKAYYPSYLISDLTEESLDFEEPNLKHPAVQTGILLESMIDDKAPPLVEGVRCKGGTSVLQAQAHCPFRAFAQYRLQATPKNLPSLGLNAKERGILVHKIVEQLWQKLKTHHQLCTLPEEKIKAMIKKIIIDNIQKIYLNYNEAMEAYWEVEVQRLRDIILAWLNLEKKRIPFKVLAQEQKQALELGGLKWEFKIDRIDQDENNNIIIIDYKTSDQKLMDCLEGRPQAPQLPLYYLSANLNIKAVAFGQLQAHACKFVGLSNIPALLPGIKQQEDWNTLKTQWKTRLEALALEFKEGKATVWPYKGDQSCRTCHLLQVCRFKSLNDE